MGYRIPLFDLNYDEREERAVLETLRSKWISTGPRTEELEAKFRRMLGVNHALAVSNCTTALHLALVAAGVGEGQEVIVPSLTFVATVNAVRYVGARPVFCDITSLDDLTIDPAKIAALINERTRAIMVMHYGGFPCDMDPILDLARKHDLRLIEDACHGPLSEYKNRKLGSLGDFGCFSFFSNKNISTGEGGILVTNNREFHEKARLLRSHGMTSLSYDRSRGHSVSYDVVELGYNYRMDDIRASIGCVQLDKLEEDLRRREGVRKLYLENLSDVPEILIPFSGHREFCSNYIFPVLLRGSDVERRDEVREDLKEAGVETSVHYPAAHRFSIYRPFTRDLPLTSQVADNEITLPMHSSLSPEMIGQVCAALKQSLVRRR